MTKGTVFLKNDTKIDFATEKDYSRITINLVDSMQQDIKFLTLDDVIIAKDQIAYIVFDK